MFILTLDKNNNKEMNISISVSDLLSQREDDLKAFEQQKGYMTNLINMLGRISDVINGNYSFEFYCFFCFFYSFM